MRQQASKWKELLTTEKLQKVKVFPAEACDIVGGNACAAVMYPEVKLDTPKKMSQTNSNVVTEQFDREYFDYSIDPRSVLREEACDDLGGEFCEAN
ncbi:Light-regulated protein 1 chloroplastic [Bienertia sinuspersici]